MTIYRQIGLIFTCACIMFLLHLGFPAQGQEPVAVRIAPADLEAAVGQVVDVAVEVVDIDGLYGVDIQLTFDPEAVQVEDADTNLPGVQVALGQFLDPGFVVRNEADNTAGSVHFVMTQLNPSEAKSGTGHIVVVRFRGVTAGATTEIAFVEPQLAQRDGTLIEIVAQPGQLEVVAQPAAGPTNTPIPVQGAGTPLPEPTATTTPVQPADTPGPATTAAAPVGAPVAESTPVPTERLAEGNEASSATEAPPPEPTLAPGNTPQPAAPTAVSQTGTQAATIVLEEATLPASAATFTPIPVATSAQPNVTSETVVAPAEETSPDAPVPEETLAGPRRVVLVASVCALGLAGVLCLVAVALWLSLRRSTGAEGAGEEE